ncbi:MAG: hypothetical protein ACYC9Y_05550 [Candidatus Methylomirabilia bacterium]
MRAGRFVLKFLLAGALSGGAYFAWVSTAGSPSPVDLLPAGAFGVVEVRGLESLAGQLAGTRFASAFAQSATRQLLERTAVVRAFDSVLAEVERISGVSPGRGSAFDLLGAEAAVGWYPPAGDDADTPWVAGGRLSARAWAVATAMRIARNFGLGGMSVTREEVAGRALYSLHGGTGQSLHVFLAGRVLVGGFDRTLVVKAARAAGDAGAGVTREPPWQAIRTAVPAGGELFAWVRDGSAIPGALPAGRTGRGAVGARLRAGQTLEIDVAAEPDAQTPATKATGGGSEPLPGIALLRRDPLFLLASNGPVPTALTELLQTRRKAVVRRGTGKSAPEPDIRPGSGYAVVITDSAAGPGFFPAPQGLAVVGMASAFEAARALPLLYPPGARTRTGGGTRALATRESFPLAGEFELWGAAIGRQLVFATGTALLDAAADDAGAVATRGPGDPSWSVGTVASISMGKALPLLRRWGAPLSGLALANWPGAPDIARDLGLLAAVGSVHVAAGSDDRFDRAAITIAVHDLR